jgi:hypothetical protein
VSPSPPWHYKLAQGVEGDNGRLSRKIAQNNSTRGVIIRKYAQLQIGRRKPFPLKRAVLCDKRAYYFKVRFIGQLRRSLTYPPVLLMRSVAAIVCNYARLPHRCRRKPSLPLVGDIPNRYAKNLVLS